MKDLFTQFSDGRLSPTERQLRAYEGIWKALDGQLKTQQSICRLLESIDRSLSRAAAKNIDEMISTDVRIGVNDAITDSIVNDLLLPYPEKWTEERRQAVRDRYGNRPKRYDFENDKEMVSWLVYNWNLYCDEYQKWKEKKREKKPTLESLMINIGSSVKNDTDSKRVFVVMTGLLTVEQYVSKQKIETK